MSGFIRVDFHCHSTCSDGALPPEGVAQALAAAGVAVAALTDHDTLEGLPAFRAALARRGIAFVTGLEVSATHAMGEIHLLAYGFPAGLEARRGALRPSPVRSADLPAKRPMPRLRAAAGALLRGLTGEVERSPVHVVIDRIHKAGGLAFMAHPLAPAETPERLDPLLAELKEAGLDGLEALYKRYPRPMRLKLARLAGRYDLLVSAGSDFHGDHTHGAVSTGCNLPLWHWERLRRALEIGDLPEVSAPVPQARMAEEP